jgi:DNA-binding MarR family transcriptional regulator
MPRSRTPLPARDAPAAAASVAERRALLKAIRRLARALDIQSRRIDRAAGLTLPQYVVLAAVRDLGNPTSRDIAREADLSPATVVGILDKLAAKGLIERARSTTDRRSVHTRPTAAGAAILARIPFPLGPGLEEGFAALPAASRARTLAALDRLAALAAPELEAEAETEADPDSAAGPETP